MKCLWITFLVLIHVPLLKGQDGWKWLESDPEKSKEVYAYFSDNFNQKNYKDAIKQLDWLLDSVPDLNKVIYIKGVRIYEYLERHEKDSVKKVYFQDQVFKILDQRKKYFGNVGTPHGCVGIGTTETIDDLKRKYRFRYKRETIHDVYERNVMILKKYGSNTNLLIIHHFIESSIKAYEIGYIDKNQLKQDYKKATKIIDYNLKVSSIKIDGWRKIKAKVDQRIKSFLEGE